MSTQTETELHSELVGHLIFETLLTEITARLVNVPADLVDHEIEEGQKGICECLGLEHSSLWQVSPDCPTKFALTHLYRAPHLPAPPDNMDGAEYFPWALNRLVRNEIVSVPDTALAPTDAERDKQSWAQFHIRSTLGIPLSTGGGPIFGILSFEATRGPREWPELLQTRLQTIAQVFANALDRKRTEQKLRESEARLQLAAQSAKAGLWTLNPGTGELWATEVTKDLLGLAADAPLNYDLFLQRVLPEDRDGLRQIANAAIRSGKKSEVEYRIALPERGVRWLAARGQRHPEKPDLLMGIVTDITEPKRLLQERAELAARLLDAQETESARIARELHDDIGQTLALFYMQFQKMTAMVQPASPAVAGAFDELRKRLNEISQRVSSMSHRLHSVELDYLGLAAAAQALCRETAERHGIEIRCACPMKKGALSSDVEISLYRILQEALNNAIRHGHARKVAVEIQLQGGNIYCRVSDDGAGFDPLSLNGKVGLGLVSMSERARIVGGECKISSSPGKGTMVECRVPYRRLTKTKLRARKKKGSPADLPS